MTPVFQVFPKMARLSREIVITEKLDGTNAQLYITTDDPAEGPAPLVATVVTEVGPMYLYAGSRNRWITPNDDNFGFAAWVADNCLKLAGLGPGRHFGEWWGRGIQRGYGMSDRKFSLFNTSRWKTCCSDAVGRDILPSMPDIGLVPVLYQGLFSTQAVEACIAVLRDNGSCAAPGFMDPEGVVVFHTAANVWFKKTLHNDESPKSSRKQ